MQNKSKLLLLILTIIVYNTYKLYTVEKSLDKLAQFSILEILELSKNKLNQQTLNYDINKSTFYKF